MKPVGEPDAVAPHVRFDERGWETGRCRMAQATAPILDSTFAEVGRTSAFARVRTFTGHCSSPRLSTGLTKPGLVWRTVLDFPAIRIRLTFPMELKHE